MARRRHSHQGPVHTLIDAHNVIYADARLRRLMDVPERARRALLEVLQGRPRLRVVCDGGPGGRHEVEVRGGITVEYAGRLPADERIVTWLLNHPHLRTAVVTDDGGLAQRVRALGARVVSSEIFLLGFSRTSTVQEDERRQPPTGQEVQDWLRYFGLEGSAPDGEEQ